MSRQQPTLALLPWGVVLEDFLDPLGISLETFCNEFRGSWMFGYVEALKRVGVRTVLFCMSNHVTAPSRFIHAPTGATICVLPAPRWYRRIKSIVLYPYGQSVSHMFGEISGARKILLPFLFLLRETLLYLVTPYRLLARAIRAESCDVILCQEYEYPRFDACVLLGKILRIPVFATFQGGNYHHNHIERFLRRQSLQACSGLIIASHTEIQRVQSHYGIPLTKVAQIFNPIDVKSWVPGDHEMARSLLEIPDDACVVAWHGRISIHKKGLDILLDAWERLCGDHPAEDLRLLLIGTGDGDAELSQRLKSISYRGVSWVDQFVHDPEIIRRYLSAADVYAFPSRYEGFPVALIEAMACGLPVVATDTDGAVDILAGGESDGGFLVPRGDAESLALVLNRVLSDESLRQKLGNSARRRIEMRCSTETVGKDLHSFLFRDRLEDRSD